MSLDFPKIVLNALGPDVVPPEVEVCGDQYVGRLAEFCNDLSCFPIRGPVEYRSTGQRCLIMVLESPHRDEYLGPGAPCPANGATGHNIRKYILNAKGLKQFEEYGLIIVNAVQYQCSLGNQPPGNIRDKVFIEAWNNSGAADFSARIKSVRADGDQVVVCCTKGQTQNVELRRLVADQLARDKVTFFGRTHPASWEWDGKPVPNNLAAEWS